MSATICVGGRKKSNVATGLTRGFCIGDSGAEDTGLTDAQSQMKVRTPGVYNNFSIVISSNNASVTTTIKTRLNGADGVMPLTVGSNATGPFNDVAHFDTVAATDTYNIQRSSSSGSGNCVIGTTNLTFTATSGTVKKLLDSAYSIGGATNFIPVGGASNSTTEADAQIYAEVAGTFKNMTINSTISASTIDQTLTTRINGGNGTITLVYPHGSTGIVEDAFSVTGHSDTVNVADLINYQITSAGAGAFAGESTGVDCITTGNQFFIVDGYLGTATLSAGGATTYLPVGGSGLNDYASGTAESSVNVVSNLAFTAGPLGVYIKSPNGITANSTLTFRQNGSDSTLKVVVGNGVTGIVADRSHTPAVAQGDKINYKWAPGGTGTTINPQMIWMVGTSTDINFDAVSNSGAQTGVSTVTWNHTVGSAPNGFLAVDAEVLTVPGTTVSSITYNGVNLTSIGSENAVSGAGRVENWGLVNPAVGTHAIILTLSGSAAFVGTAASYYGVNQTTPTESWAGNHGVNAGVTVQASVGVTPIADKTWVYAAVGSTSTSIAAGQTSRNNVTGAAGSGMDEDSGQITPAALTTMTDTGETSISSWIITGYAIRPYTASSGTASPFNGYEDSVNTITQYW